MSSKDHIQATEIGWWNGTTMKGVKSNSFIILASGCTGCVILGEFLNVFISVYPEWLDITHPVTIKWHYKLFCVVIYHLVGID